MIKLIDVMQEMFITFTLLLLFLFFDKWEWFNFGMLKYKVTN